jgi:hypothetical protein
VDRARDVLTALPDLGIDLDKATHQLEVEGVAKFSASYDALMERLAEERVEAR